MIRLNIQLFLLMILAINLTSCATVILDNDYLFEPGKPDPIKFTDPICVKIDFKSDNIDPVNRQEGVRDLEKLKFLRVTTGLTYYNILIECKNPVVHFEVIYHSQTKNLWIKTIWAATTLFTLGVIPFYMEDFGYIEAKQGGNTIETIQYSQRRFSSVFAIPKWFIDNKKSSDLYKVDAQRAMEARWLAKLIKASLERINTDIKQGVSN